VTSLAPAPSHLKLSIGSELIPVYRQFARRRRVINGQ